MAQALYWVFNMHFSQPVWAAALVAGISQLHELTKYIYTCVFPLCACRLDYTLGLEHAGTLGAQIHHPYRKDSSVAAVAQSSKLQ
jgi:hypothetical protein